MCTNYSQKWVARDKDVTLELLEAYGIKYSVRPSGWWPLNLFKAGRFVRNAVRNFDKCIRFEEYRIMMRYHHKTAFL